MSSSRLRWAMVVAALGAVLATSVAVAATKQTYVQKFTTTTPGKPSGMTFAARASAPTGEVPAQAKTVTLTFPSGTKIDTGALPACKNTSACPAKSKLGSGKATVLLGPAQMPPQTVTAYNRAGGMVLSISNPLGSAVVLKPVLKGGKLTLQIPTLKLGTATLVVSQLSLNINKLGTAKRPYVRTPRTCPKTGSWSFTGAFTYVDGTSKTLTSKSPCKK